jgi:hypothetical protein
MAAKYTWTFKARLRAGAFGWRGSHLACQRLKETVTEIKKVARTDPVTAITTKTRYSVLDRRSAEWPGLSPNCPLARELQITSVLG